MLELGLRKEQGLEANMACSGTTRSPTRSALSGPPVASTGTFTSRRGVPPPSAVTAVSSSLVYVDPNIKTQKPKQAWKKEWDIDGNLTQIPALRPREYSQISRPKKTVQRAYGGSRCANCVRDRVVRAFLIEEQKIVKKVMKEAEKKQGGRR